MLMLKEIGYLIKKDVTLELRQKYAISGILLYVLSTVFVVYLVFIRIEPPVWNTIFWIIVLFASVNAVAKSFIQESGYRALYYYSIANPIAIIISKIIYNFFLLFLLTILTYGMMSLVVGNPVKDHALFWQIMMLSSLGFSITFTFISGIAVKANNSATLMTIMSFPVVIPILITLVKLSASALRLITDTSYWKDIATLLAIDLILVALALVLFPFVWKN